MARVVYLPEIGSDLVFPPLSMALEDGMLCFGGDLSQERLLLAYSTGIFPWYSPDQPIIWWSPDPRAVMIPKDIRISHNVRKLLRQKKFQLTKNAAFTDTIAHCRKIPRQGQDGSWITPEMEEAYISLHHAGFAHSYEAWQDGELVGGLYGVNIGRVFFGESMFSLTANASKVAFAHMIDDLLHSGITLCDCQVANEHTLFLGAKEIPRTEYLQLLQQALST
jgi:leucyl/phenylalanyl-tRNA---protein transferase